MEHVYDPITGQHRIKTATTKVDEGWTAYTLPTTLVTKEGTYIAFSEYYHGTKGIEVNTIYKLEPLK
jgi:hypothetical protein